MNSYKLINPIAYRQLFRYIYSMLGLLFLLIAPVQAQYMHDGELILRMGDVSANKFPFILAKDQGMYKKNGLNVVPKFSPGSVATINKSGIEVAPENIYDPDDKNHRIYTLCWRFWADDRQSHAYTRCGATD